MATIAGSPDKLVEPSAARTGKSGSLMRREARWGYFFISPFLIGFFVFTFLPTVAALVMSFTNFKLSGGSWEFIGVQNYIQMFKDPQVWASLGVTLKYALIALPVAILFPLGLAVLLNTKHLWGKNIFRTLFYFPYIVPFVAAIFVWAALLNPETGWINKSLRAMGVVEPPNWVNDTTWVYPALVILGIWGVGNAMLIFLASLQGVPTELYDASKIDGAGWWATMRNVTLPLISPVIFYNLTLAIVGLFQYFTVPLGAQPRHRCAGRRHHVLQSLPLQAVLHVPKHGLWRNAGLAALCDRTGSHAGDVRDAEVLGLLHSG